MDGEEIERAIKTAVAVTPALVVQAKAFLAREAPGRTAELTRAFLREMDAEVVQPVLIRESVADLDAVVRNVAWWLSCQMAVHEAIWALIGTGVLVPRSGGLGTSEFQLGWTTVIAGSGGNSSGWRFGETISLPVALGLAITGSTHLTDGHLYLANLGVDLETGVAESLVSAVDCFRVGLYLPSQVMLGRAAEGMWIRAGQALVRFDAAAGASVGKDLERGIHFARLPERVSSLYTNMVYKPVADAADVAHADLRTVSVWTDALREARNAVHPTVDAPLPETWETTAALLMGAVPNMRRLHAVAAAATRLTAASG